MKYDCNKILDFVHEYGRMCESISDCKECPLYTLSCNELSSITAEHVAILQKWSDEHPEIPKLTREEYSILQAFKVTADKHIERRIKHLFLVMGYTTMELWPELFPFIKEGETWFLDDLLKLEVMK